MKGLNNPNCGWQDFLITIPSGLTAIPGDVIVVAVVNLEGILPDTDIECLVVVSLGWHSLSWLLRNCSIHSHCSSESTGAISSHRLSSFSPGGLVR